jgi:hypothetical protein
MWIAPRCGTDPRRRRAKLGTTRTRRSISDYRRIIDANPWSWEPFPDLF